MRVFRRSVEVGAVLAVLAVAVLAGVPAGAAPDTASAGAAVADTNVRTIERRASLGSLDDAVGHLPEGTLGPETPPGEEEDLAVASAVRGAVGRSLSTRPDPATARSTAPGELPVPVAPATRVSRQRPGLSESFEGINLYQERYVTNNGNQFSWEPPDQGLCVGNGYVLETVNSALRVYDTNGNPASQPISLNTFYGYPAAINRTTGKFGPQLVDPSCFYDDLYDRWVHVVLTLEADRRTGGLTLQNHVDLAVSRTDNPRGGWDFYAINTIDDGTGGTPSHQGCPCIGDYPHIGADRYGVYVTVNEYPWFDDPGEFGTNFNGAQLYAFSRRQLASGPAHLRALQFENIALTEGEHPIPAFTLIPASSPEGVFADADGGSEYLLSSTAAAETGNPSGRSDRMALWTLSNTRSLDGPVLAVRLEANVVETQVYGVPPLSEQKQGPTPLRDCLVVKCLPGLGPSPNEVEGPLDSSDTRVFNTWYDGERVWGTLDTIVEVGGNIQAGGAWFAFRPDGTVAGQGYLAVAGNNVIYPGLATLPDGRGAVGFTLVGDDWFPTAAYSLVADGRVGVFVAATGLAPEDGFCEYVFENCAGTEPPSPRPRWGDYPAATTYNGQVWFANEYIASNCTYEEWLADFTCHRTRGLIANWSTRVSAVTPEG
ncbi:MAG TPA: hypothetical protein VGB14_10585 [Acidimicrobiales bacterium]|jgi:hypothetical protein